MEEINKLGYLQNIGRVVTEQYALGQLADNCIYALPSDESFAQKVQAVTKALSLLLGKIHFVNDYDFEMLEEMPAMDNHPTLAEAILELKCNLIMPLRTPYLSEKYYLLVKANSRYLRRIIMMMIYESERITRLDMSRVLLDYAKTSPRAFCNFFERNLTKEELEWLWAPEEDYLLNYSIEPSDVRFCPDYSENKITYQEKTEIIGRVVENLKEYKKNNSPRAKKELERALKKMEADTLLHFLSSLPKKYLEQFGRIVNPVVSAEESKLRLEVKKLGKEDPKFRTNGKFRLYFSNETDQQHVHFKYKESIIVYLIYLIDKLKKDKVDSISIKKYKTQFVALFNKVYSDIDAESRFDDLIKNIKNGKPHQAQIKHCYADIRFSIGNVCEKMHELPEPFILKNAQDHLSVLKERITVHKDLLDAVDYYGNGEHVTINNAI